jgi:hypothetical protein
LHNCVLLGFLAVVSVEVHFANGAGVRLEKLLKAAIVGLGESECRLALCKPGHCRFVLRLIRGRIDFKEHLIFFDEFSFFEINLLQVTRDSRAHFDRIDRRGSAGEIGIVGYCAFDRITDRDSWRRRGRRGLGGPRTSRHSNTHYADQSHGENCKNYAFHPSVTLL